MKNILYLFNNIDKKFNTIILYNIFYYNIIYYLYYYISFNFFYSIFYKFNFQSFTNHFYWANIWKHCGIWILSIFLSCGLFIICINLKLLPLNKLVLEYFLIIMFLYWLLSNFSVFIRIYKFGRFTSSIQRFWKRSFLLFWVLEGMVFCIFFYLTLRSGSEPWYMYDSVKFYHDFLISWRIFFFNLFITLFLIFNSNWILFNLKWSDFYKIIVWLLCITLIIFFLLWREFYQIFYTWTVYNQIDWNYNLNTTLWSLQSKYLHYRNFSQYMIFCLIAKFWHVVFIFVFWIFFILRSFEIKNISFFYLSCNIQNLYFLYILTWLPVFFWIKYFYKLFWQQPYYWIFIYSRNNFFHQFLIDWLLIWKQFFFYMNV